MRSARLALLTLAASVLAAFSPAIFGVFRNETNSAVNVNIVTTRGEILGAHIIPPHAAARFPINNGAAIARTTSGETVARCDLRLYRTPDYYDFPHRNFYFRVTHHRIELVPPERAHEWLRTGLTNR